ncbi:MAG TPA: DUF4190 domain-containing protein [Pyrinomonadaceae bacterium]|nr:DUF4190 domain-containing protein [Pyrinomonadaceae bacterium]
MKSSKCAKCGFVGWPDAEFCKRCGASMSAAVVPAAEQPAGNFTAPYPNYAIASPAELKKGLAVASLVIGILNFFLLGIFGIPIIVGIVLSVVALNKINRYPHEYGGKPLAIGGLVTNIVSAVFLVPVMLIAAIAIPNLLAARMAANEGAAMNALIKIHGAEQTFQATRGNGYYGTLDELRNESLIAPELAGGIRSGYRFKIEIVRDRGDGVPGFAAVAVPTDYRSSGRRSFFIDETGVLRGNDSHGDQANRNTPPVNFDREYPERRLETRRSSRYADDE